MELKINIGYRQVFEMVEQLPERDVYKLMKKIQGKLKNDPIKRSPIQMLICQAPTWTDEEYENYLETRTHINQSRLK
jgi:hypothetical protein